MIKPELQNQFEILLKLVAQEKTGCYLVGGALRDSRLNRLTQDVDFAVSENPKTLAEKSANIFKAPFFTLKEEREIYRVSVQDGLQVDFAKFKGTGIEEDLSKRDFTLNAMAIQVNGTSQPVMLDKNIIDPHGGKKDIDKKIVRQVSPEIYSDDPLRLLRAFRIAAQLRFQIDPETFTNIKENKDKILKSSAERIREELLMLFECPGSYPYIQLLDAAGLVSILFPEIDPNRECAPLYYPGKGVWGHCTDGLKQLEWIFSNLETIFPEHHAAIAAFLFQKGEETEQHPRTALMKLGILLHDVGKAFTAKVIEGRLRFFAHDEVGARMAKLIAQRLKFSSDGSDSLSKIVQWHMRPGALTYVPVLTDKAQYRFFRDLGISAIPVIIVSLADRYTYLADEERGTDKDPHERVTKELVRWYFKKQSEQSSRKPRIINGTVLIEQCGLAPGPLIGQILQDVEESFALGEIHTEEEAVQFAKNWLRTHQQSPKI